MWKSYVDDRRVVGGVQQKFFSSNPKHSQEILYRFRGQVSENPKNPGQFPNEREKNRKWFTENNEQLLR